MAAGMGPSQKTLRTHVEQPPGHALAVQELAILLLHQVAVGSHGDQQAQPANPAFGIDPVHRQVGKAQAAVAQQVLNGSGGAHPHHLVAQPTQCTRQRGLAETELFLQGAGCGGASAQVQAQAVGME